MRIKHSGWNAVVSPVAIWAPTADAAEPPDKLIDTISAFVVLNPVLSIVIFVLTAAGLYALYRLKTRLDAEEAATVDRDRKAAEKVRQDTEESVARERWVELVNQVINQNAEETSHSERAPDHDIAGGAMKNLASFLGPGGFAGRAPDTSEVNRAVEAALTEQSEKRRRKAEAEQRRLANEAEQRRLAEEAERRRREENDARKRREEQERQRRLALDEQLQPLWTAEEVIDKHLDLIRLAISEHGVRGTRAFADERLMRRIIAYAGAGGDAKALRGLFDTMKDLSLPDAPQALRAAAACLEIAPTGAAVKSLMTSVKPLLLLVKRSIPGSSFALPQDSDTEQAAATVLSALGACAAYGGGFRDFAEDNRRIDETKVLIEERNGIAEEHSALVQEYNDLVPRYNSALQESGAGREMTISELVSIQSSGKTGRLWREMQELKDRLEALERRVREIDKFIESLEEQATAPFRLQMVFCQGQDYSVEVRQGAAIGLGHLLKSSHIAGEARVEIEKLLADCLDDPEAVDLRTYRVRLMPKSVPAEATYALRRGLAWMVRNDSSMASYSGLHRTVCELCRRLPEAVTFLEKYPLRLMSPGDNLGVLGNYIAFGYKLRYWTRYTPIPPGANTGPVQARWIEVLDGTTPNSMGIAYPLFRHPCLALPVIYHEYLHHRGERNEGNVWLREAVFQKGLIAEFAPGANEELSAYEADLRGLLDELTGSESAEFLRHDLSEPDFLGRLNRMITGLYGPQMTEHDAESQAEDAAEVEDVLIAASNARQKWDPQIKYPLLRSVEGSAQRQRLCKIVKRQRMQRNILEQAEFDMILAESALQKDLAYWSKYACRAGACAALFALPAAKAVSLTALVTEARMRKNPALMAMFTGAGRLERGSGDR